MLSHNFTHVWLYFYVCVICASPPLSLTNRSSENKDFNTTLPHMPRQEYIRRERKRDPETGRSREYFFPRERGGKKRVSTTTHGGTCFMYSICKTWCARSPRCVRIRGPIDTSLGGTYVQRETGGKRAYYIRIICIQYTKE